MTDDLIEQIKANPDDDDPRLVWADREGGERGELVVIQCALAKGGLERAELTRLLRREYELVTKLAYKQTTYVRGFVEHAAVSFEELAKPAELFAVHPLLKSVFLRNASLDGQEHSPRPDFKYVQQSVEKLAPSQIERIAALPSVTINGDFPDVKLHGPELVSALARAPIAPVLKGLRVDAPISEPVRFAAFGDLEHLAFVVERYGLPTTGLFARHPKLRSLGLRRKERDFRDGELEGLLQEPGAERLEALAIMPRILPVARAKQLTNLKRLDLDGCRYSAADVRELADAPHLATVIELTIGGPDCTDEVVEHLTRATFASTLKVLEMRGVRTSERGVEMLTRFPALERLAFQHGTHGVKNEGILHETIPLVTP